MAYGELINSTLVNEQGETCRVILERDGYSSTTYSPSLRRYSVDHGETGNEIGPQRRSILGMAEFAVTSTALLQELRKVPRQASRNHKLTIKKGGSTEMVGYAVPDATTTPRNEKRTGVVTVRAKDRLKGLGADWTDSGGSAFSGLKSLATIISGILNRLGLSLPIRVVHHWRPQSMVQSDDPLSLQVDADAFYRTGDDGEVRKMEAGAVLEDILEEFNLEIIQRDGQWEILQPGAFTSQQTDANDDVTVFEYNSSGTFQTSSTRSAAVDLSNEGWKTGTGEVSGEERIAENRSTYEHGAPDALSFEGGFETATGWSKTNTSPTDLTFQRTTSYGAPYEGSAVAEAEGAEFTGGSFKDFVITYFEHQIGALTPATEPLDLVLRVRYQLRGSDTTTLPAKSRAYWSIRLDTPDGKTYYYVDDGSTGWDLDGSLTTDQYRNVEEANDLKRTTYRETTRQIPAPPDSGDLYVQLWNPVWDKGIGAGSQTLWGIWDGIEVTRAGGGPSKTTYRVFDTDAEEGETVKASTRIGQGPWKGAPGAVLDDSGDVAFEWSLSSSSDTYALPILQGRRRIAIQSRPTEATRFEFVKPSTEPTFGQAIDFDGQRYWPVSIQEAQEYDRYKVRAIELVDSVPSGIATQTLPGGGEDITDTPSSTSTSTSSTSTTTAVAFDAGDDGSNESEAISEIATTNDQDSVVTEPNPDKVLFDFDKVNAQVQTKKAGSDLVDDPNVVNVKEGAFDFTNPSGREVELVVPAQLDHLTDVDSAVQADGNVIASGGASYREEGIDALTADHVSLSDLSDVGTTSATDGHVIASDGTDFDSEAITSLTGAHVSLSDLSDVGSTSATDGHVIASDGTDFDSEGIASVAGSHLSLSDLNSASHSSLSGIGSDDHHTQMTWSIEDDGGTNSGTVQHTTPPVQFDGGTDIDTTLDTTVTPWQMTIDYTGSGGTHTLGGSTHTDANLPTGGNNPGRIVYDDGTEWADLAVGSDGYVLTVDTTLTGNLTYDDPETLVHDRPSAGQGMAENTGNFDVRLDIEDGGTDVTTAYGINFGSNLNVTDDGDNTVTVALDTSTVINDLTIKDDDGDTDTFSGGSPTITFQSGSNLNAELDSTADSITYTITGVPAHALVDHSDVTASDGADRLLRNDGTDWVAYSPATGIFDYNGGWQHLSVGNGLERDTGSLQVDVSAITGDALRNPDTSTVAVDASALAGTHLTTEGSPSNLAVDKSSLSLIDSLTLSADTDPNSTGSTGITADSGDPSWSLTGGSSVTTDKVDANTIRIDVTGVPSHGLHGHDDTSWSESSETSGSIMYSDGSNWQLGGISNIAGALDHSDLTGVDPSDHHTRYSDSEAVSAVETHGDALTIDITGDADTLDGQDASAFMESWTIEDDGGTNTGSVTDTSPSVRWVGGSNVSTTLDTTVTPWTLTIDQSGVGSHTLGDHTNTGGIGSANDGEILWWNGTNGQWETVPVPGSTAVLENDSGGNLTWSTNYVSSTEQVEFTKNIGFSVEGALTNTLGTGDGEVLRFGSDAADFLLSLQGGIGRQAWTWNAYYDSGTSEWKLGEANEDAVIYGVNLKDVGESQGSDEEFNIGIFKETGTLQADDAITWDQEYAFGPTGLAIGKATASYNVDANGDINVSGKFRESGVAISLSTLSDTDGTISNTSNHVLISDGTSFGNGVIPVDESDITLNGSNEATLKSTAEVLHTNGDRWASDSNPSWDASIQLTDAAGNVYLVYGEAIVQ